MPETAAPSSRRFYKIGLLVTGKGEEQFLPHLFRVLTPTKTCSFKVLRRIPQLSPIRSEKRLSQIMKGDGRSLPSLDTEIGLAARTWLGKDTDKLLLLVDDLEHARREEIREVFGRYRTLLDTMLSPEQRARASVHFLVNMLEAYYFAHAAAVNTVLNTNLVDHAGDVEEIRHPKNDLKKLYPGFDEVMHGEAIVKRLDVEHVLGNPQTCTSLRVLFAWCVQAMGGELGTRFCLDSVARDGVTGSQLASPGDQEGSGPA